MKTKAKWKYITADMRGWRMWTHKPKRTLHGAFGKEKGLCVNVPFAHDLFVLPKNDYGSRLFKLGDTYAEEIK